MQIRGGGEMRAEERRRAKRGRSASTAGDVEGTAVSAGLSTHRRSQYSSPAASTMQREIEGRTERDGDSRLRTYSLRTG